MWTRPVGFVEGLHRPSPVAAQTLPTDTPRDRGDSAGSLRWEREFAAPVGAGARIPRGCGPPHGKGPSRGASHLLLPG